MTYERSVWYHHRQLETEFLWKVENLGPLQLATYCLKIETQKFIVRPFIKRRL